MYNTQKHMHQITIYSRDLTCFNNQEINFLSILFISNLKKPACASKQHLSTPTIVSKQKQHPVLFKIPYFKTNHKTSHPTNTFQNKNIKTTHFLPMISSFFFFHFFSTLLKRLCITTKYIKSKIYYSMYSWLFSTNPLPQHNNTCCLIRDLFSKQAKVIFCDHNQ